MMIKTWYEELGIKEHYYADDSVCIINGDCLEVLPQITSNSMDAVITDPPYGTTACAWDEVIPLKDMWNAITALRKDKTPVALFGSEPFASLLRVSNIRSFKYDWVWRKNRGSNFATLRYQPMKEHETISVFYPHNYYPIKQKRSGGGLSRVAYKFKPSNTGKRETTNGFVLDKNKTKSTQSELRFPSSVQDCNTEVGLHPTQKPLPLIKYLVETYSKPNEIILDFALGSGTTALATKQTNRKCVGIEISEEYCELATIRYLRSLNDQ